MEKYWKVENKAKKKMKSTILKKREVDSNGEKKRGRGNRQ